MSILSAIRQQSSSIDDLAKLPQAMIMQMAQRKQIATEMVAPILARKAEMIDATAKTKAMQGGVPQTSVMEQIIAQNAQSENPVPQQPMQQPMPQQMQQPMPQQMPQQMEDTGVAQLPIPEREYAGGGIIAFADGGLSDEDQDYEDSLEEADYNAMIERAMNAGEDDYASSPEINQIPQFETRQAKGSPQTFTNSGRDVGIASGRDTGNMDARLRAAIMQKESGGRRYDKEGRLLTSSKGAEGEMQVMPNTARDPGFGIKPARDNSPDELRRVGDEYASVLLRRYRDPTLAMIAYNMGPGATDKWLAAGADPRKLPKETQGYIRNVTLAGGGEVRHFANAGYVDPMGGYGGDYEEEDTTFDPFKKALADYKRQALEKKQTNKALEGTSLGVPSRNSASTDQAGLTPEEMIAGSSRAGTFEAMNKDTTSGISVDDLRKAQTKEAPKSRLDEYMDRLIAREGKLEKQKSQDANLALLSAGLGMMGGTSRYALENIGKGALAGVQNFSESSKQRGAEQAALDKSMLYATRYQGAEDVARQNAAYSQAHKGAQLQETSRANTAKEMELAQNNLNRWEKNQLDLYKIRFPVEGMPGAAEEYAKIYKNPAYIALAKRAGVDVAPQGNSFAGFSAKMR
jgi:hypothetical protein